MKSFRLKILTKLGSTQFKEIQAETEEAALRKAETKFPLHKEIKIVAPSLKPPLERQEDPEFEYKLAEVKLNSREKKAKGAKREGWAFMIGGIILQLTLLAFTGLITIWLAIPIIWGIGRITYGSAEQNRVTKERQAIRKNHAT